MPQVYKYNKNYYFPNNVRIANQDPIMYNQNFNPKEKFTYNDNGNEWKQGEGIFSSIPTLFKSAVNFVKDNKDTIGAVATVGSAINSISRAKQSADELRQIKRIQDLRDELRQSNINSELNKNNPEKPKLPTISKSHAQKAIDEIAASMARIDKEELRQERLSSEAKKDVVRLQETKKLKGINIATIKKCIKFDDYKHCLYCIDIKHHDNYTLNFRSHKPSVLKINKVSLSPYDDKRYILGDGIDTKPFE